MALHGSSDSDLCHFKRITKHSSLKTVKIVGIDRSIHSPADMVSTMKNPEATMCSSHDQSLGTASTNSINNVLLWALRTELSDKIDPYSCKESGSSNDEHYAGDENHLIQSRRTRNEDVIFNNAKSTVKYFDRKQIIDHGLGVVGLHTSTVPPRPAKIGI